MSKETLHLMLKLNTEDLDTQVALQCAPLLTGMKISNLLTVGRSKRAAVLELFKETAVSCCILYESSEKTTFLLYIRPALEAYLSRPEVKVLMLGYPAKDVTGFIENNGKNFLYIGYWKVYSDLSECKRIFQSYNHAREHIIHMVSRGMKIDAILRIHNLNQYKSMTR